MRLAATTVCFFAATMAGCDGPAAAKPPVAAPVATPAAKKSWDGTLPVRSPREAWEARRQALLKGDAEAVWRTLGSESRSAKVEEQEKVMEEMKKLPDEALARALAPYGIAPGAFCRMSGEEFCLHMIRLAAKDNAAHRKFEGQEFVDAEIKDGRAACRIGSHSGQPEVIVLTAEEGDWKVDEAETIRLNGRSSPK